MLPCISTLGPASSAGARWTCLSTDDEIVKTVYAAFELTVKHEIMEGFKVDGTELFNPHLNFEELIKISNREVSRK